MTARASAAAPTTLESWLVESDGGVTWLRSPLLHREGFLHAFSTRRGGVSAAPFDSMNLGIADAPGEPDAAERVQENWRRLLAAAGLAGRALVRVQQVHGCDVRHADREHDVVRAAPPLARGDALVSADARHAIAVRVADCVPVLIADVRTRAVAAVHAGWRGVASGIVPAALRAMIDRGAHAPDLRLAIGPCIRAANYQVGAEVARALDGAGLSAHRSVDPREPTRWRADLPSAIAAQAMTLGLRADQLDDCRLCTHELQRLFFSYRRDGARGGRLAAVISP